METLSNKSLKEVKGGISTAGIVGLVIAGITFVVGLIDGYVRPQTCKIAKLKRK